MNITREQITSLRRKIWRFYGAHERQLPFRHIEDPYKVTVSEIMLQQTQVERVTPKYERWVRRWPNWRSLADASARELLSEWSGLGYNRRALYLGRLAVVVVKRFDGVLPQEITVLKKLPGIGEYTARAILIFAHNERHAAIDTNIRQVLIHELGLAPETSEKDLQEIALALVPRGRAREWHYALMDFARLGLSNSAKRKIPKARQARFAGSLRQIRGEIVRRLTEQKTVRVGVIANRLSRNTDDVRRAALALEKDGVVKIRADVIRLA